MAARTVDYTNALPDDERDVGALHNLEGLSRRIDLAGDLEGVGTGYTLLNGVADDGSGQSAADSCDSVAAASADCAADGPAHGSAADGADAGLAAFDLALADIDDGAFITITKTASVFGKNFDKLKL